MARPLRIEFAGAVYHVTARGNAKQDIYLCPEDKADFLHLLARACDRHRWHCHAYCLMMNHYHLLIETGAPSLSKGMKYLNGTYTQSFNRRHRRVGHLFQGRFKGILVEADSYLLELARYIVLNPVRAGMVSIAAEWSWSSYRATAGLAPMHEALTVDWILGSFGASRDGAQKSYQRFVAEGKYLPGPWKALKNQIYLGSNDFVKKMLGHITEEQPLDDIPKPQKLEPAKGLEYFLSMPIARKRAMAEAYRSGHYTLAQVGEAFGVSHATVSRAVKVFEQEIATEFVRCKA